MKNVNKVFEDCKKIIDQMSECGIVKVNISGGEPLVRKDFIDILSYIKSKNIVIGNITTNGALLNEQMLKRISDCFINPNGLLIFDINSVYHKKPFRASGFGRFEKIYKGLDKRGEVCYNSHRKTA